jgi:hypothetical protein
MSANTPNRKVHIVVEVWRGIVNEIRCFERYTDALRWQKICLSRINQQTDEVRLASVRVGSGTHRSRHKNPDS